MARSKALTPEEERAKQIQNDIAWLNDTLPHLDTPTYQFGVGEHVQYGGMEDSVVEEVLHDGKMYVIRCSVHKRNTEEREMVYRVAQWTDIRPIAVNCTALERNRDLQLSFNPYTIEGVLHRYYHFGVDMDPAYQRGYVWEQSDKELLIDSIFSNIKIGEMVFVERNHTEGQASGCLYEILDGKQRLDAIRGYYENRYPYQGLYFNDLSAKDRHVFLERVVPIANLVRPDSKMILRCFLMLNRAGKHMDPEHLKTVETQLKELEKTMQGEKNEKD